jgi:hypothetical protein
MGDDTKICQRHVEKPFAIMLKKFWAGLNFEQKEEFRVSLYEVIGRSPYGAHERTNDRTAAEYDEHVIFRFLGIILTDDPNWSTEYKNDRFRSFLGQLKRDLRENHLNG